jgi:hypothetical protein
MDGRGSSWPGGWAGDRAVDDQEAVRVVHPGAGGGEAAVGVAAAVERGDRDVVEHRGGPAEHEVHAGPRIVEWR